MSTFSGCTPGKPGRTALTPAEDHHGTSRRVAVQPPWLDSEDETSKATGETRRSSGSGRNLVSLSPLLHDNDVDEERTLRSGTKTGRRKRQVPTVNPFLLHSSDEEENKREKRARHQTESTEDDIEIQKPKRARVTNNLGGISTNAIDFLAEQINSGHWDPSEHFDDNTLELIKAISTATFSTSKTAKMSETPRFLDYVTLISNDGYEFMVERRCAYQSGTLKRMLGQGSTFAEARTGRCQFDEISGVVLEKIVEYMYYAHKYAKSDAPPNMDVPPELCLMVLVAADYLNL